MGEGEGENEPKTVFMREHSLASIAAFLPKIRKESLKKEGFHFFPAWFESNSKFVNANLLRFERTTLL